MNWPQTIPSTFPGRKKGNEGKTIRHLPKQLLVSRFLDLQGSILYISLHISENTLTCVLVLNPNRCTGFLRTASEILAKSLPRHLPHGFQIQTPIASNFKFQVNLTRRFPTRDEQKYTWWKRYLTSFTTS